MFTVKSLKKSYPSEHKLYHYVC